MAYKDNNYKYRNNGRNYAQERSSEFEEINIPLHLYYKDKKEIYLKDKIAHGIAKKFKRISVHQLRKVLNQSKLAKQEIERKEYDLDRAMNILFSLLPIAAYNAGRENNLMILYDFLSAHLNNNSITCKSDIEVFDELFTSIVAYHKYEGGK